MHRAASLLILALVIAGCSAPPAGTPSEPSPATEDAEAAAPHTDATPSPAVAVDNATEPATAPPAMPSCDWTRQALPQHRVQVETTPESLRQRFTVDSADAERLAALLERPARPLGEITGAWRVRSLQLHMGRVYVYPFFQARIDADACGHRFAKTTGSQRRSGVLYPIGGRPDRLAFLGAATVNEDPPRDYDPARPASDQHPGNANSAGWLARIGRDELLMVLDAEPDRFEAYHLRR